MKGCHFGTVTFTLPSRMWHAWYNKLTSKLTERYTLILSQKPQSATLMPSFFPVDYQLWLNYVSHDPVPPLVDHYN